MNYFEEEHELEVLEDLFDYLDIDGPDKEQMITLFSIFNKDMVEAPIFINQVQVAFNKNKSKHPLFRDKPEGFTHICTRKSKHSKRRNFDPERTNKIHWIKPVIHFKDNARVKYFERVHSNGKNQQYYWLHEKSYVVIIREITISLQLVTAFKVDDLEFNKFKKWHDEFTK